MFNSFTAGAGWASQYRAAEECYLIEVPKEVFQSEVEEYQKTLRKFEAIKVNSWTLKKRFKCLPVLDLSSNFN